MQNIYLVEEVYETKMQVEQLAWKIEGVYRKWGVDNDISKLKIYADPSEPDDIDKLDRLGLNIRKADNNVVLGIKEVSRRLKLEHNVSKQNNYECKFFVSKRCKNFIDEILTYSWEDDLKYQKVKKEDDHLMDAMRYAIYNHFGKDNETEFIKEEVW
jgi:hypothetical protein